MMENLPSHRLGTEQEGFEPPVPFGTVVFKTTALNRSATAPDVQPPRPGALSGRIKSAFMVHSTSCREDFKPPLRRLAEPDPARVSGPRTEKQPATRPAKKNEIFDILWLT